MPIHHRPMNNTAINAFGWVIFTGISIKVCLEASNLSKHQHFNSIYLRTSQNITCVFFFLQIDIGQGLRVAAEARQRIQARDKDSMFVKDLLITIWDPAQLQGRSLQGSYKSLFTALNVLFEFSQFVLLSAEKHCPRFPDRPRKEPLTPWKVSVMQGDYSIY